VAVQPGSQSYHLFIIITLLVVIVVVVVAAAAAAAAAVNIIKVALLQYMLQDHRTNVTIKTV